MSGEGKPENKMPYWKNINQGKEEKEKEMIVLSEKGKKISIKTEVASSSIKPYKRWPVEHAEEASKRKYEVIGTDIETEYEEMATEEEESEVRKLTEEDWKCAKSIKNSIQYKGELKGRFLVFRYIHRLKVKEHFPGVPSHVAEMLSHPTEEVQDIDHITEQEVIEIEWKTCHSATKMSKC